VFYDETQKTSSRQELEKSKQIRNSRPAPPFVVSRLHGQFSGAAVAAMLDICGSHSPNLLSHLAAFNYNGPWSKVPCASN